MAAKRLTSKQKDLQIRYLQCIITIQKLEALKEALSDTAWEAAMSAVEMELVNIESDKSFVRVDKAFDLKPLSADV